MISALLALALSSFIIAGAVSAFSRAARNVSMDAAALEQWQQADWALREMARDLARHGRFGCALLGWRKADFSAAAWHLRLAGTAVSFNKLAIDGEGKLQRFEGVPQALPGASLLLSSCLASHGLGLGQWSRQGETVALHPALPVAYQQPGALHLPSLQLWMPLERRYRLHADGRLERVSVEAGDDKQEAQVMLSPVRAMRLKVLVQEGCAQAGAWRFWEAWNGAGEILAAQLELDWQPEGERARTLSRTIPLASGLACPS
ncbi:hypothetical protein [Chromobacterium sp. IIBBL 290-4]|uniref:hypothetical protein n=1 Tax=Chromobacterium sp. IIBBL 290-4 TaxID=2953890 RepID=UPI0020B68467|nr:hypothetical protein [Chromobacterium sp. IIBBL 290-4]UTH75315.1 hypothetical protein NKT35_04220 [Chromobacterium sp. IIBBL 290-4]